MNSVAPGFHYQDDALHAEAVDIAGLAEQVGTPF